MNDLSFPPAPDVPDASPVILYVDDEAAALKYFQRAIGQIGVVATAESVEDGKRTLDTHCASLCVLICDQRMPGAMGNELLQYARDHYPYITRILTTAYSEVDRTVEAINQGHIFRYIAKPWDISGLRVEVRQALDHALLWRERDQLLREKMLVSQQQIVWSRIAAVHALCVALGRAPGYASATYLSAATQARVGMSEPDWRQLDLVDVISADATRIGQLTQRVMAAVADMHRQIGPDGAGATTVLAGLAGTSLPTAADAVGVTVADPSLFAEFLDSASDAPIGERHVQWLALLITMDHVQRPVEVVHSGGGVSLVVAPAGATAPVPPLAAWLENY